MKKRNQDLRTGLFALIVVIVIIFIIGLIVNKPEPIIIQGEADASEIRISGKVPGRIQQFLAEEGTQVKVGDTLVIIDSPELAAKLEQANAAENAAQAQAQPVGLPLSQFVLSGTHPTGALPHQF